MLNVDLWLWPLELSQAQLSDAWPLLAPDEIERAKRFVKPDDRDMYVAGRARLREILGGYTGQEPRTIAFDYGQRGKPSLAEKPTELTFNLSHSGGLAALAVSRGVGLGLDIEFTRPIEDEVARHHFSKAEYAALSELPPALWREGFYRCWTRKEAVIKAIGEGLWMPLDQFDVTLAPGAPAKMTRIEGDDPAAWQLVHLEPAPGCLGALALRTGGCAVEVTWRSPR